MPLANYQVTFDADLEVLATVNVGPVEAAQRVVGVIANSPTEARRMARILVGQNRK